MVCQNCWDNYVNEKKHSYRNYRDVAVPGILTVLGTAIFVKSPEFSSDKYFLQLINSAVDDMTPNQKLL